MIFIFEGPDGAGKTFLARELVKKLDGFYIHDRYTPKQWCLNSGQLRLAVKLSLRGRVVVLDRHWVGDNIYSAVFRPGQQGPWVRRMDSVLQRFGATYVMCLPSLDQLEASFQELRKQRPEKYDTMTEVAKRYSDLYYGNITRNPDGDYIEQQSAVYPWEDSPRNLFVYNRFTISQDEAVRWITRTVPARARHMYLKAREADPLDPGLDAWELSGSLLHCKALLVGERAMHLDAAANWPFYSDKECAAYLTAALQKARVCETHIALTNAYSVKGNSTDNFMRVIRWVKHHRPGVRIVAMGRTAEKVIKYHGYRVDAEIAHPQHARRFNHHGPWWEELGRAIYGT